MALQKYASINVYNSDKQTKEHCKLWEVDHRFAGCLLIFMDATFLVFHLLDVVKKERRRCKIDENLQQKLDN